VIELNSEQNYTNDQQKPDSKKKKPFIIRVFLFLLKAVLVIAILIGILFGSIAGYNFYQNRKLAKEIEKNIVIDPLYSKESIYEQAREDGEGRYGKTIDELLEMGVDPSKLDTDGDGLTDYDEIHIYETDPSKFSTAGDGVSDMVKVLEGLDPHEKIKNNTDFQIDYSEYDLTLQTADLNDKYFSYVEPYEVSKVNDVYNFINEPIQIKNYQGRVRIDYPDNNSHKDDLKVYQFNFDTLNMEEVKKQDNNINDNYVEFDLINDYPVYLMQDGMEIDENQDDEVGTFYYFRISIPFLENLVGFNHKVFIFKQNLLTSKNYTNKILVDDTYGIADYSYQAIGRLQTFMIDKAFEQLDSIFVREVNDDTFLQKGGIVDYGKVEGTLSLAKSKVMPWLFTEDKTKDVDIVEEVNLDDNEDKGLEPLLKGLVVADTGFDIRKNAFKFDNFTTEIGPGGVCAGFSRITERIYNGNGIPLEKDFSTDTFLSWVQEKLADGDIITESKYDLTHNLDHYTFIDDKNEFYNFKFTGPKLSTWTDNNLENNYNEILNSNELSDPDKSVIQLIETQYLKSNDEAKKLGTKFYDKDHANIITKVINTLSNGDILQLYMQGSGGHAVNPYRIERAEYNQDKYYLFVYDNNLPYDLIQKYTDEHEVKVDIYMYKRKTLFGNETKNYSYFEYHYEPLDGVDYKYSNYGEENTDNLRFFYNDKAIKK